jgi:sugar phosphate isomerase/epimerase
MMTRREFGLMTLAGLAFSRVAAAQVVNGVRLGVQSYSFRDMPRTANGDALESVITAMKACGLTECELWAPQVEPQFGPPRRRGEPVSPEAMKARQDIRSWRLEKAVAHLKTVKQKLDAAGITVYAYNYSPSEDYTDAEIEKGFEMAKALGTNIITASTTVSVAKRIAPYADKHQCYVSMHGHSNISDPNEFATPESFAAALQMSKWFKINLDIGHFTAANYDAIAYLKQHHGDITNLHLKDRSKNQGDNVPWGQGQTPIKETLQLLKREKWPIRAYVEYEYQGAGSSIDEVKKCLAYAKQALA